MKIMKYLMIILMWCLVSGCSVQGQYLATEIISGSIENVGPNYVTITLPSGKEVKFKTPIHLNIIVENDSSSTVIRIR